MSSSEPTTVLGFQLNAARMLRLRGQILSQLGRVEEGERASEEADAILEDDASDLWLPMGWGEVKAPDNWPAGVTFYGLVVAGPDGSVSRVERLSLYGHSGAARFAAPLVRELTFPIVETGGLAVDTAMVVKVERSADGMLRVFRARRYAGIDLVRAVAPERFDRAGR